MHKSWMYNCASIGYTLLMKTKDAGLRIRVERELREAFLEVCRAQDRPAAQVVRDFMRQYIAEHRSQSQGSLFPTEAVNKTP